jgi:hypothetical protein
MQPLNYIISIPEPCHEDWNSMTPDANGKFCNSCSKSVIDFTNKTDAEIHAMMMERKNEKVCGHFKKTQVNRPLALNIPFHTLPRNLSPARAFAVALFIVFGTLLFSCTNEHNQKINEITVTEPEYIEGMMLGEPMLPFPQVIDTVSSVTSEGVSVCKTTGDVSYVEVPVIDSLSEVTVEGNTVYHIDRNVTMGGAVYYIQPDTIATDSVVLDKQAKPEVIHPEMDFTLQAYPNPTSGNINISYEVLKRGNVQLDLFDIKGVLVKSLVSQQNQYEGKYIIPTDLSNLIDGIYICRVIINGVEKTTKLIIAK